MHAVCMAVVVYRRCRALAMSVNGDLEVHKFVGNYLGINIVAVIIQLVTNCIYPIDIKFGAWPDWYEH